MKSPTTSERDTFLVAQIATLISVAAFFYFLRHDQLVLYGDAVAHMNIARRVFDSRTPGLLQLGTVWLPLPHLLMLPFLLARWLWQTGIGGSFPSMLAYVFSVTGVFRLVRTVLPDAADRRGRLVGRFTAWLATAMFALNPNLIYLQTTAMTEPLYLAFFIWVIVFFAGAVGFCRSGEDARANAAFVKTGLCLAAACLTRYDGWLLSVVMVALAISLVVLGNFARLGSGAIKMALIAGAAPFLWLAYNAAVYRNPLEFANGPYSAKAIEEKTAVPGFPPHPGSKDLRTAFHYFFKSAQLNLAAGGTFERNPGVTAEVLQRCWVLLLLFGTATVVLFQRKLWPVLLLWMPVPFYMLSIGYSGVPIFIPVWWPYSYYNVRYGIELLPAFALLGAIAGYGLMRFTASTKTLIAVAALFWLLPAITYVYTVSSGVVSHQEAVVNARTRIALERQLASIFETMPPHSTYLMYLGDHPGAFQRAGFSLSHVINEGNHRPWKRPSDPEGLWESALAHPASYADFVVAMDSDPVAASVNKSELDALVLLHVTGQPEAIIYKTRKSNQAR
jgi:hypothetical protein